MHVLLVEDEPGIARFISQELKESGYAVDVIGDGLTGFNYATSVEYDLIIVDILLPGMDGLQLLGKIRNQKIKKI